MRVDHVGKHDGTISPKVLTCPRPGRLQKPQDDHKLASCDDLRAD